MKLTILGCGTSSGVPRVPENWGQCDPANPKNRRRRSSVQIEAADGTTIIIDTTPDLREQLLAAGTRRLDAVFYTHDHADHCHGIDDLRAMFHVMGERLQVYGDMATLETLRQRFRYIFYGAGGYPPICRSTAIDGPVRVGPMTVIPFEQGHGDTISLGYRVGPFAYSTDLNRLSESAFDALEGVDIWVVDALRYDPHPTHAHLEMTLGWIERVKPRLAVLTHMTEQMDYETLRSQLPEGVEPGYDGMVLTLSDPYSKYSE